MHIKQNQLEQYLSKAACSESQQAEEKFKTILK